MQNELYWSVVLHAINLQSTILSLPDLPPLGRGHPLPDSLSQHLRASTLALIHLAIPLSDAPETIPFGKIFDEILYLWRTKNSILGGKITLLIWQSWLYNLRHRRHDRTPASKHDQRNFIDRQKFCINIVTNYTFVPFIVELRSVQFLLLNEYVMLCYIALLIHYAYSWKVTII